MIKFTFVVIQLVNLQVVSDKFGIPKGILVQTWEIN